MKLKRVTVAATAIGDWIPLDRKNNSNVGIVTNGHPTSAGTYTVEITESDLQHGLRVPVSRSTTTLTVNYVNHGLAVGDGAIVSGSGDYDGQQVVAAITDADNFTITVAASGDARFAVVSPVIATPLGGFNGVSGKVNGLINASVVAVRLNCTSATTAPVDMFVNQQER